MTTKPKKQAKDSEVLLSIRNLHIEGQSDEEWHPIVKGVDFDLHRGEVLGLIGESGAGKSTIGLAAMGFARPGCKITQGDIMFDGVNLFNATENDKRSLRGVRISYVAQSAAASFNPAHRLIEQYSEAPVQHGVMDEKEAHAEAITLFEKLQLPDPHTIGFRYPHQVSGGQLQRAMTAMAMACKPDLIIFDEPTTALDVTTQIEVLAAIKDIVHEFNTAAIYITHDLAVVAQMADKIIVLRYGEVVEEADTRKMLSKPEKAYTKSLWAVRSLQKKEQPSDDILLEMRNIDASYGGGVKVLKNVSIKVPKQRTVAVVGESGSGKSTAARAITGLLPPMKGEVIFKGETLSAALKDRKADDLRKLQMIYQMPDTALNPRMRIRDIIGRPVQFYMGLSGKKRDERVSELLNMIEMEPNQYVDRFPGELSGGQKQRVCIARALAAEPELIICDEVTSALDQLVAEEILKLLQHLQDELELSYMFITHDLATVRAIADEIVVMLQGEVVEQGLKTEILTPPHHEYTDLLLSSVPEMDPDWLEGLLKERAKKKPSIQLAGN
ncbi:MAG: ABC transporter ATP-binding protein [Alphaproteobacteria bacterium]|nr:ABC transporter ATP-binding protein [Alphaproteobacteria bacterium]